MGQTGVGKYRRTTPESRQQICDLYGSGLTIPEVAARTGFSQATVTNVVRAAGITGAGRATGVRTDPETEAKVIALYEQGMAWTEIVRQTGRTEHTVSAIIKRNGGELGRHGEVTAEMRNRIPEMYDNGMDAPEIGRVLGCHSSSVYNVLREAGMDRRERIACERPDYFDVIDTPEKAYWLGFIGADGCVTGLRTNTQRLQIKLARKDRNHLLLLHATLKATRPVIDNDQLSAGVMRPYSTLTVYSQQLVAALISHGITPKKSHTLQPWEGTPDLMPHYWRGLMDGDGHITINERGIYTGLVGSEYVARAYAEWVNENFGTRVNPRPSNTRAWTVQVGGSNGQASKVRRLLAALYDDAPVALARKKALADLAVHGKPIAVPLF